MPETIQNAPSLWPLAVWTAVVVGLVAAVLGLSAITGPSHRARRRDLPYESGMPATGDAQIRFPVAFYLVAIDFLVFDVEAAILFAWAGVARDVGWTGWIAAALFVLILTVGLVWVWAKGGLDWGAAPDRARRHATADGSPPQVLPAGPAAAPEGGPVA